jgi:hypothetical protein
MTDVATRTADTIGSDIAPPKGLLARAVGVIISPRETYADIAAHPRVLGALALVLLIVIGASTGFLMTEVGKNALFDQQLRTMESFGIRVNDQMYDRLEQQLQWAPYFSAFTIVTFPVVWAVVSGIIMGVFSAVMGGDATFKQVYAIVVHSGAIVVLQALFGLPLAYARESLSGTTNLGVFFPFLDENSFAARMLGALDLFLVWWMVSLAIGLGVLYRRRTGPIATTLLVIYAAIGVLIAAIKAMSSGV